MFHIAIKRSLNVTNKKQNVKIQIDNNNKLLMNNDTMISKPKTMDG